MLAGDIKVTLVGNFLHIFRGEIGWVKILYLLIYGPSCNLNEVA